MQPEPIFAAPNKPGGFSSNPPSPSNNNDPHVIGAANGGATVRLWSDAACTQFLASGSAESFGTTGIGIEVPDNSTTDIYADASDGAEDSACSTEFITYEEDSIPPEPPTDLATAEFCRINHNTPLITGQAPAGTTVTLYIAHLCLSPLGTGTAEQFSSDGIEVFVRDNSSFPIYAAATDEAGNVSACSQDFVNYIEDSVGPPFDHRTFGQHAFIKASNTGSEDYFGGSVAISGDTLVVGAWAEDSDATGIDGNEADNSAEDSGAVYVYVMKDNRWVQQAYIKAFNTDAGDHFGASVAIDGDTLAVGAPLEASNAQGIDGDESNDLATNAGAVYVFERDGVSWSQTHYIKGSNTESYDLFGGHVDIEDQTLLVGALGERSNASGVNGNQSDNSLVLAGAAYIFVRDQDTWVQQAYLKATNPDAQDRFTWSVDLSGNTVAIGAVWESSNATGINGDSFNNLSENSGAVYVYVRTGEEWSVQAYIKAHNTDPFDNFGTSVALSGNILAVGSPGESSSSPDEGGDPFENTAEGSGAAYVYERRSNYWQNKGFLKASNAEAGDRFGQSLAFNGRTIAVGAYGEDSVANGVGGDQADNSLTDSGAIYVFLFPPPYNRPWYQTAYVKAQTPGQDDVFGYRLAMYEDTLVTGTKWEDSNTTGTHGNETDNSLTDSGAAWVLRDTTIFADGMEYGIDRLVFPDPALACCVQQRSEASRWTHASQVKSLDCDFRSIKNIVGLEALTNLETLGLSYNLITDISPLSGLNKLEILGISVNKITSIEPLRDLSSLLELSAFENGIEDLTPLSESTQLTDLNVGGNNIQSLAPLEHLTKLRQLIVQDNPIITDLSPLADMADLASLYASGNSISDLTPLSGLSSLRNLLVQNNQLTSLEGLQSLQYLSVLAFSENQITDLAPLEGLSLSGVYASDNQIDSLAPLQNHPWLRDFNFSNNLISDISVLQDKIQLVSVWLEDNQISDITPLLSLPSLYQLHLTGQGQYLDCTQQQAIVAAHPGVIVEVDGFWDDPDDEPDLGLINCFP